MSCVRTWWRSVLSWLLVGFREGGDGGDSPVPRHRSQRTAAPISELESYFDADDDGLEVEMSSSGRPEGVARAPEMMHGQSFSSSDLATRSPPGVLLPGISGLHSPQRPPSPPLGSPRRSGSPPPASVSPKVHLAMSPPTLPHSPKGLVPPVSPTGSTSGGLSAPASLLSLRDESTPTMSPPPTSPTATSSPNAGVSKFVPRSQLVGSSSDDSEPVAFGGRGGFAPRGGRGRGRPGMVFQVSAKPKSPAASTAALTASGSAVKTAIDAIEFVPASAAAEAVTVGQSATPVIIKVGASAANGAGYRLVNYGEDDEVDCEDSDRYSVSASPKRPMSPVSHAPPLTLEPVPSSPSAAGDPGDMKRRRVTE
jgi:hypothetical protein